MIPRGEVIINRMDELSVANFKMSDNPPQVIAEIKSTYKILKKILISRYFILLILTSFANIKMKIAGKDCYGKSQYTTKYLFN
jgi:hypothetical protein